MDIEQWEVISVCTYYEASTIGRIRRIETSRIRKMPIFKGYRQISLNCNGKQKTYLVHTLVAHAFLGERLMGYEVNHIDGNRLNNCITNLEYVTRQENVWLARQKTFENTPRGEEHKSSKLTQNQVDEIRLITDMTQTAIAKRYGVYQSTISLIRHNKSWRV